MNKVQLRQIIKSEISKILGEGIQDIKRAQRAGNKGFVDPLVAKKNARAEQMAMKEIEDMIDDVGYNVDTSKYERVANELNIIVEPIDRVIKKYGLTDDIKQEIISVLELDQCNRDDFFKPEGLSCVTNFNVLEDIVNDEGGTALLMLDENGLHFFEHPFNETYGDSINSLIKDGLNINDALSDFLRNDPGNLGDADLGYDFSALSPDDKVFVFSSFIQYVEDDIVEYIRDAENALKYIKPKLIKLAKMYK